MKSSMVFDAPWATSLKFTTLICTAILLGVGMMGLLNPPSDATGWPKLVWRISMVGLPLLILGGTALFLVRSYELTPSQLLVNRLGWQSKVRLENLQSVEIDPQAMERSLKTFGNGGLFCFCGNFRNKKLGSYRAMATDPKRSVILRFPNQLIVVTPGNPQAFAEQLNRALPQANR